MHEEIARLTGEGLFTDEEIGTTCCFATQDKVWVTGPAGEKWEVYTVLADSDTFGSSPPRHLDADTEGPPAAAPPRTGRSRRGHVLLLVRPAKRNPAICTTAVDGGFFVRPKDSNP